MGSQASALTTGDKEEVGQAVGSQLQNQADDGDEEEEVGLAHLPPSTP